MKKWVVVGICAGPPVVAALLAIVLAGRDHGRRAADPTVGRVSRSPGQRGAIDPDSSRDSATAKRAATVKATSPVRGVVWPPRDPALAALLDPSSNEFVTADITHRIPRLANEEDLAAARAALLDADGHDTVRNEVANILRRSDHGGLTDDLIRVLCDPAESQRFRAFCIQHLWLSVGAADAGEKASITSALLEALDDRHVAVRREALLALVRMRDPKGEEAAVGWLLDPKGDGVRDAAIRCVRELGLRNYIPVIREYLYDDDVVVRIAAIVALSEWGDQPSREAIASAAKSGSHRLRRCATMALKRLDQAPTSPIRSGHSNSR